MLGRKPTVGLTEWFPVRFTGVANALLVARGRGIASTSCSLAGATIDDERCC